MVHYGGSLSPATLSIPADAELTAKRRSFLLAFACTLVGAAAQMFIKSGAGHLSHPGFIGALLGMITNPMLFLGYALYGFNTVLMAVALRDSELSILWPIIALTYVWVAILSVVLLHETMNPYKVVGIAAIVLGVAVLGWGGGGRR
jgi:drug/metabolite transporter (DMT)-like permease